MKMFLFLTMVMAASYSGQAADIESGWTEDGEYVTCVKKEASQTGEENSKKVEMERGWTEEGEYIERPVQQTSGNHQGGEKR